jgi:hypothetical protein
MTDRCADCGADAGIYYNGVALCLLCCNIRDSQDILAQDLTLLERVHRTRQEYRQAIDVLRAARELRADIGVSPDGVDALKHANTRFASARAEYHRATADVLMRAREVAALPIKRPSNP